MLPPQTELISWCTIFIGFGWTCRLPGWRGWGWRWRRNDQPRKKSATERFLAFAKEPPQWGAEAHVWPVNLDRTSTTAYVTSWASRRWRHAESMRVDQEKHNAMRRFLMGRLILLSLRQNLNRPGNFRSDSVFFCQLPSDLQHVASTCRPLFYPFCKVLRFESLESTVYHIRQTWRNNDDITRK